MRAEGNQVGSITRFDPFGNYRPNSAPTDITDRGYTGHKHNDDIGLIYMNARYYLPSVGRFVSADTIVPNSADPQDFNRFSYVRNNPLKYVDPSGHNYVNFEGGCISGGEAECPEIISEGSKADDWYNNGGQQAFDDAHNPNLQEMPDPSDTQAYFQWTWDMMAWCMRNGCDDELTNAYFMEVRPFLLMGYEPTGYWSRNEFFGLYQKWLEGDMFYDILAYAWIGTVGHIASQFGPQGTLSGSYTPCSFSADTLVETKDGPVPIALLEKGTFVLAYDEQTGEIGYYPILVVWAHEDPVIVYLTIDAETIITTPEHPFYTEEGEWVAAGELQIGNEIRSADGEAGTVQSVLFVARSQTMYNLTVAKVHTYFVSVGQWLVHNQCPPALLNVGNLQGKSLTVAESEIQNAGYYHHSTSAGGYINYRHPSGARIIIRPNGEVIRLGTKLPGTQYRPRYDYLGNPTSHNSGEFVLMP